MALAGKKIILAVSGSIAAYKAATLCRLFIKSGAEVRVIMTPSATEFVKPLTFSTLSKNAVYTDVIDNEAWNNHVELGLWADLMLIAPATATTISKMASANCDNILTAVYLSAKCPVFIAPAMDRDMWLHPANLENIDKLRSFGNTIIDPDEGELASGLHGKGRMAEPEDIIQQLDFFLSTRKSLEGMKVLVTAGPTYEAIDPVRFLGNRSTGKMGVCLAMECVSRGARVDLVIGPSHIPSIHPLIHRHNVQSAQEMYEKAQSIHAGCDIVFFSAAVADYKPATQSPDKIKKTGGSLDIRFERTKDIAAELGRQKKQDQIHVGFALESDPGQDNALRKLSEKAFDLIVLNSLRDEGAGFGTTTNKVTIYCEDGSTEAFDLKTKEEVATDIVNTLVSKYLNR